MNYRTLALPSRSASARLISSFVLFLLLAGGLLGGCKSDSGDVTGPIGGGNTTTTTTTIVGRVVDENGKAVQSAQVEAYGRSVNTDKNGIFTVTSVTVPSNRCFVIVRKAGFFDGARASVPEANGVTNMRLSLMSNTMTQSVAANTGGTVTLSTGASIRFEADGFVTASGNAYSGQVRVAARHITPDDPTFYNYFSGDMTATRTDNSIASLISFGVIRVEIKSASGESLKLATGKEATLTYPVPTKLAADAPQSIPLWYFDETIGMWKEEGTAELSGSTYTGKVKHFSDWNCDQPWRTGTIKGRVVCGDGPISGVVVSVWQLKVITDANGYFSTNVPTDRDLEIGVLSADNAGLFFTAGTTTHRAAVGQTLDIGTVILASTCPAYLKGRLVDCDNKPIGGLIMASWDADKINYIYTSDGVFNIVIPPGKVVTVSAASAAGMTATDATAGPGVSGNAIDIGDIMACGNTNAGTFIDLESTPVKYYNEVALSRDGKVLALSLTENAAGEPNIGIWDGETGKMTKSLTATGYVYSLQLSDNGNVLAALSTGGVTVWDVSSGNVVQTLTIPYSQFFLHPDGTKLYSVDSSAGTRLHVYSVATGTEIDVIDFSTAYRQILGFNAAADGVVAYDQTDVYNWSLSTKSEISRYAKPAGATWANGLSSDRSLVMFQDQEGFTISEVATGVVYPKVTLPPRGNYSPVALSSTEYALTGMHPDSSALLTVFKAKDNKLSRVLLSPSGSTYYNMLRFSSDGKVLVGAYSGGIRLWRF